VNAAIMQKLSPSNLQPILNADTFVDFQVDLQRKKKGRQQKIGATLLCSHGSQAVRETKVHQTSVYQTASKEKYK
jgi:hypothetical protein